MIGEKRKTGIDVIGDIPWGTHLCQFYQTEKDLIDILVPYFKTGLKNNEFCMWVTSEPLHVEEAKAALKKAVKILDDYIKKGQIEILDYSEWYTRSGKFNADEVLQGWVEKEKLALEKGFDGLRLMGNTFWLESKDWKDFSDYEAMVNSVIGKYHMIAICSYSLDRCGASEIIDVVSNHQFAIIRKRGKWQLIESSERKRMEEALRESEVKLRLMFESVTDGITVTDLDGFITALNERALGMHGFRSKDEVLGKHAWEFIARRDHYKAAAHTRRTLEQGRPTVVEYTLLKADGSEFPGEISTSLLKDAQGNLVGFIGIIRDITERKRAEEALKDSEERYKSLVTNVKLGVFRSTPGRTGRFLEVNPAMEEITGYSREELLKMNVSDLYVHPERREAILKEVASATGEATKELRFRKKDGTEIVVSDTKVAVRDNTGKILYFDGIIQDITERKLAEEREKELQQQLYLSSRLVAIGELAAGVAHEINNPLTGILGFSQRLLRKSAEETQVRDLEIICNEAQRAAKVVENLLTFARRCEPKKQYADINDILQKALELRAYELKTSNIEVDLDLDLSLPKTMVDFHQIQEVFLNIILNAEQAISETNRGGKLSIKTQPVRDYIKISFADDGPGIPAEHLDKLFDPFFTTRRERGGTGLGLSVCYGIVAEHGGRMYAKSKPGKGATFFVELPVG